MGNVTSIQRIEAGGSEKRAKQNPMCQTSHRRCGGTSTEKIIFGRFLSKKGDELYSTKQDIIFKISTCVGLKMFTCVCWGLPRWR